MPKVSFLIFVVFNHYYKDGNHPKNLAPRTHAILVLMLYEYLIILFIEGLLIRFAGFSILELIFLDDSSGRVGRLNAAIIGIILYPINHWFFIRNNRFDMIYEKYRYSDYNTRKNRVLHGVILIIGFPIILFAAAEIRHF